MKGEQNQIVSPEKAVHRYLVQLWGVVHFIIEEKRDLMQENLKQFGTHGVALFRSNKDGYCFREFFDELLTLVVDLLYMSLITFM